MARDIRVTVPEFTKMPFRLESEWTDEAKDMRARSIAGRNVFEGMAGRCVDNTQVMFKARDDIQGLVRLRLESGDNVDPAAFLAELEVGGEIL